ncbi:alanine acetyltransferase [Gordoniibacillus kamchatkensis]|uniref:Alanine acetyltransferase n=2 Tax=Gordoniibacillus kamchatkensis TaxID=1590651 RepID=A0ABR5A9Y3_9BACL|nr:alanine acetyltransferase [Paenibacillus sp. VKM B-2647]
MRREGPQGEPVRTSFRPMRESDIPVVCAIEQESFPTPWTEGAFRNELSSNNFAHYVIMQDAESGEIAGYGGMWLILEEAHVTNVAVRAAFRGRGLGERLMRELMSKASFLGALRMTLEVRQSNLIAQGLYEKVGFHAVGVRRGYYTDNNEDAVIMWADLPKARRSP